MKDAKPLHVLVAEALGWENVKVGPPMFPDGEPHWMGKPPRSDMRHTISAIDYEARSITFSMGVRTVDRYDTDWSATGPLIERMRIELDVGTHKQEESWYASLDRHVFWDDQGVRDYDGEAGYGAKPLQAVCNLLLELKASGKLLTLPR